MKKIIFTLYFLIAAYALHAQSLYGTALAGGDYDAGTICKLDPATKSLTAVFGFSFENGISPSGGLVNAHNGKLYGMTTFGGTNDAGVIYSFDAANSAYTKLKEFNNTDGAFPRSNLIQSTYDGKLYGMTSAGGNAGYGVIFSYDPSTLAYKKLKDFNGITGAAPQGGLLQASNGKLYGMTTEGGSNGLGVIFSYDPAISKYTKLIDFNDANGANPYGSLMQASDGKLYGTTANGGSNEYGVIFSYDPATSAYTKIKDLDFTNGAHPRGHLVEANQIGLYGMTSAGGSNNLGVIFMVDLTTLTYYRSMSFDGAKGGATQGSLVLASDQKLYGMTHDGGSAGYGVAFIYDYNIPNQLIASIDFTGANGKYPTSSFFTEICTTYYYRDEDGDGFGDIKKSVIACAKPPAGYVSKIGDCDDNNKYVYPGANETCDNLDNNCNGLTDENCEQVKVLYTLTKNGGSNNLGTICKLVSGTVQDLIAVHSFDGVNSGANPFGTVIQAGNGKLYGMTYEGGINNKGVIFSYDPVASTYNKLIDFDGLNGANPYGSLMQAADGKLYGMTAGGGNQGYGVVFSYDPAISVFTKLFEFSHSNGANPHGGLMQASDGKLYGMTNVGGEVGQGVMFSYDPLNHTYVKLQDFKYSDIHRPYGNLTQALDGKLYGLCGYSGSGNGNGGIFSFDPVTGAYTIVKVFNGGNGSDPGGNLMLASDGKLYGMTIMGGTNNRGVIFSYNPVNSVYAVLFNFNGPIGAHPYGSLTQASNGKLYGMTNYGGSKNVGVSFSYDITSSTYTLLQHFAGANGSNPFYTFFSEACKTYYKDADQDGYGDLNKSMASCSSIPPAGYAENSTDCDDTKAPVYPDAAEVCDNIDNNCNGLVDEDCPVNNISISIANKQIQEGNKGSKNVTFNVTINKASTQEVKVNYKTANGTATAGSDFVATNGILTFEPGVTTKPIIVSITGDKTAEPDEIFSVKLSNPVNAVIIKNKGTGTILNDDVVALSSVTQENQDIKIDEKRTVQLQPNPASNIVNVSLKDYKGNVTIQLCDFTGKVLRQDKIQAATLRYAQQSINVWPYANGTYLIIIIDEKGNRQTEKLIISR